MVMVSGALGVRMFGDCVCRFWVGEEAVLTLTPVIESNSANYKS